MVSSILLGLLFIALLIIGLFVGLITVLALGSIMGIKIESLSFIAIAVATIIVGMFFT